MTLRRALSIVGAIIAAVSLVGAAILLIDLSYRPAYDRSNPDYQRYAEAFDRLRIQFERDGTTKEELDLSPLNNGAWKEACVFGGYTNPLEVMQEFGANIAEKDRRRLSEAGGRGFRLGQVAEYEMMIAYVDVSNNAHFIHFEQGIGPDGKRLRRCAAKPITRVFLRMP